MESTLRSKLVQYLGYCSGEDTRLWKATACSCEGKNPPTFVLTEAEVLRGRGGKLAGPHVGQSVAFELPSGPHHAVVTAYYPPTDQDGKMWSIRYDDDDDMADLSVRPKSPYLANRNNENVVIKTQSIVGYACQEDELSAALDLHRRLENNDDSDEEDGADNEGPVSLGQLHLRNKMLQEEAEAEAAKLQEDQINLTSQSDSIDSYSLSTQSNASAAEHSESDSPTRHVRPVPQVEATCAGTRAETATENTTESASLGSSQDCFPTYGSLPGGTRDGDFLAPQLRSMKFKCCAHCGRMAKSNRLKACTDCGSVKFVAKRKLQDQLTTTTETRTSRAKNEAVVTRTRAAVARAAGPSSAARSAAKAGAACPFCVVGSGKIIGHRGPHKRSLSKYAHEAYTFLFAAR